MAKAVPVWERPSSINPAIPPARARHADWAVPFATRWGLRADYEPRAGAALAAELDNLVLAHRWLVAHADKRAATFIYALMPLHHARRIPVDYLDMVRQTRTLASHVAIGTGVKREALAVRRQHRGLTECHRRRRHHTRQISRR